MSGSQDVGIARQLVVDFLEASMAPDPDKAATFLAPDVEIFFTGKTKMAHPRDMTAYNANRYNWVKKKLGPLDIAVDNDKITVYSVGTLYGEWPDGTPFEGNRYVDRFEVIDGKITRIDVWNDSAERILKSHMP